MTNLLKAANRYKLLVAIATQGGGISQIVFTEVLSQTVQMVTRQAMTQTLQGVVVTIKANIK